MEKSILLAKIREIMMEFSDLTGLSNSGKPPKRYLWTDAFAVCNFLELYRQTREEEFKDLALRLVVQVHQILGRHRPDDSRTGWISGLGEAEGSRHPTLGGLRIGKSLPERRPAEPYDPQLEWDRDGQYYHYLTKWMQALNQVSRATGELIYNRWALELAKTAHARFVILSPSGIGNRMVWKMSIDLSFPLVPSMGHHDPLDGLLTYAQLLETREKDPEKSPDLDLKEELAEMALLCRNQDWATDDPLGLGGLMSDAYRSAQLIAAGRDLPADLPLRLLTASQAGLASFAQQNPFQHPADFRLAFRELGLSIGLRAVEKLEALVISPAERLKDGPALRAAMKHFSTYGSFREQIESFWLDRRNRALRSWTDHREINMVMLATSLAPDGYLTLI
ncbi:MAG: hypothetical protein HY892_03520 [Deltaproteobacteria bacterium]|nr:hypothetical protein [Deltaproteobacteria bacterium]